MKKLISSLLAFMLMIGLSGCNDNKTSNQPKKKTCKYKVGQEISFTGNFSAQKQGRMKGILEQASSDCNKYKVSITYGEEVIIMGHKVGQATYRGAGVGSTVWIDKKEIK